MCEQRSPEKSSDGRTKVGVSTIVPIGRPVIGLADMIVAYMCELGFDGVRVPFATFIEEA